jgi:hypothetical protein
VTTTEMSLLSPDLVYDLTSEAITELIDLLDSDDDLEELRGVLDHLHGRIRLGVDNHPEGLRPETALRVLNAAADATGEELQLHDMGERDAINLVVNVVCNSLDDGELADFDDVADENYVVDADEDDAEHSGSALEVILGWIRSAL